MKLPKSHPFRSVTVKPWAKVFLVPRHIVRIDIDEPGKVGTHGWQVRYRKQTKLFSDAKGYIRKNLSESLLDATNHLASIYKGRKSQTKTESPVRKENEIKEVGIRLIRRKHSSKNFEETYIEVSAIEKGKAPKRFYVGTSNTVTPERISEKLIEAKAHRKQIVAEHELKLKSL